MRNTRIWFIFKQRNLASATLERVAEQDSVLKALGDRGVLDALIWAHGSAYGQVRQDYTPEGGHKQGWIGYSAHTYLLDRLDRVFQCGDYAAPLGEGPVGRDVLAAGIADRDFQTMPSLPPGLVTRQDLNGSPGWAVAGWRWLLASYRFGEVTKIKWPEKSATKQSVARQPHDVDDGGLFPASSLTGLPPVENLPENESLLRRTLVLAHAMDPDTVEFGLFLGRIRWNADKGDAWAWRYDMLAQPPRPGGQIAPPQPTGPITPTEPAVPDAPVQVRGPARGEGGPRAIGDA